MDVTVPVEALGAVALGGSPVRLLAAGWLQEERAGGARRPRRASPLAGRPLVRHLVLMV